MKKLSRLILFTLLPFLLKTTYAGTCVNCHSRTAQSQVYPQKSDGQPMILSASQGIWTTGDFYKLMFAAKRMKCKAGRAVVTFYNSCITDPLSRCVLRFW